MNRRYPRYPDDADYQTNAPSYYEDLARKNKLIKKLAKRIWEYDKILADSLEEIEEVLRQVIDKIGEGFNEEIYDLLTIWVEDGTLDHIINETLMNKKADKTELKDLEEKITKTINDITIVIYPNDNYQEIIDNAQEGSILNFKNGIHLIDTLELDKPFILTGTGEIKGTFKPFKKTIFKNLKFKNINGVGIDYTETVDELVIENCYFENVHYPINAESEERIITNIKKVTIKDNTFLNSILPINCRFKKIEQYNILNNIVDGVKGSERYVLGFRIGATGDDKLLINNITINNNIIKNVTSMVSGNDFECSGINVFSNKFYCSNNYLENIWTDLKLDSEGIYSKSNYNTIKENVLVNAGGDEGSIVIKRNTLSKKNNNNTIENNTIYFDNETRNSKKLVGILVSQNNTDVTNNKITNAYTAVDSYSKGSENLKIVDNEFKNGEFIIRFRVTDIGNVLKPSLISNNKFLGNNTSYSITTADEYISESMLIIKKNYFENIKTFFKNNGQVKRIVINDNYFLPDEHHVSPFIEQSISNENDVITKELIINNNHFGESNGRILTDISKDVEKQYDLVEIKNNTITKIDIGFTLRRNALKLIVKDNIFLEATDKFEMRITGIKEFKNGNLGIFEES